MIKTLQEARDRFDKLFDQAYEILILGFLSDIEHWDIGNSDKLTLGDNGDLVYNEYKIINNFIDLYRVYPRLFDDNEDFNKKEILLLVCVYSIHRIFLMSNKKPRNFTNGAITKES